MEAWESLTTEGTEAEAGVKKIVQWEEALRAWVCVDTNKAGMPPAQEN